MVTKTKHSLYCMKQGSHKKSELYKGSLRDCKRELFGYLCKDADCPGEIETWRALERYCKIRDIPLSFSSKHNVASYDTWSYFID